MRRHHTLPIGLLFITCAALARGGAPTTAPVTVIDHDPMGTTVGSPAPIVGTAPGGPPKPPARTVVPDPSLNQIVIEQSTPITVSTGNKTATREQLRLQCYDGQGEAGGTIRLRRLREGPRGDYSLVQRSVGLSNGVAEFVIRFHRGVLHVGPRFVSARTVYLVTSKVTRRRRTEGAGDIQTVTVLSDDPAAFPHDGDKE